MEIGTHGYLFDFYFIAKVNKIYRANVGHKDKPYLTANSKIYKKGCRYINKKW